MPKLQTKLFISSLEIPCSTVRVKILIRFVYLPIRTRQLQELAVNAYKIGFAILTCTSRVRNRLRGSPNTFFSKIRTRVSEDDDCGWNTLCHLRQNFIELSVVSSYQVVSIISYLSRLICTSLYNCNLLQHF